MKLFIKNMVDANCIDAVTGILEEQLMPYEEVTLGQVSLPSETTPAQLGYFKQRLEEKNYAIIFSRKHILTEQVKHFLYSFLENNQLPEKNYSSYIAEHLHLNYTYVANIFSETEGTTIEHFIINRKIEKAKSLLKNTNYSISRIANILFYSSIAHLSNQFKKITGVNPSAYKRQYQHAA